MNKQELVEAIARDTQMSKADSQRVLSAFLSIIISNSKKDPVKIAGFGSFRKVKTKARMGINPQTQEKIKIPAKEVFKFKASKKLDI